LRSKKSARSRIIYADTSNYRRHGLRQRAESRKS